jgi:hypothetical protein
MRSVIAPGQSLAKLVIDKHLQLTVALKESLKHCGNAPDSKRRQKWVDDVTRCISLQSWTLTCKRSVALRNEGTAVLSKVRHLLHSTPGLPVTSLDASQGQAPPHCCPGSPLSGHTV